MIQLNVQLSFPLLNIRMHPNTPAKTFERKVHFELSPGCFQERCGVVLTPRACIRVPVPTARWLPVRTLVSNATDDTLPSACDRRQPSMPLIDQAKIQTATNRLRLAEGCKRIHKMRALLEQMGQQVDRLTQHNKVLEGQQREILNENRRMQQQEHQLNQLINDANLFTIDRRKKVTAFDYDCIPDVELLRKYRIDSNQSCKHYLTTYNSIISSIRNIDSQMTARTHHYQQLSTNIDLLNSKIQTQNTTRQQYQFYKYILQIQLNPYFQFGLTSYQPCLGEQDLLRLFAKVLKAWNKKDEKEFDAVALRRYVLLQLYPAWEELLNALPYTYSGYRELFCDCFEQGTSQRMYLENVVHSRAARQYRHSERRVVNVVVYSYSQEAFIKWLNDVEQQFKGCKNTLLEVCNVTVESGGRSKSKKGQIQSWNINVDYQNKWSEGIFRKVINIQLLKELTLEGLIEAMSRKQGNSLVVKIMFETICEQKIQQQLKKVLKMLKKYR